MEHLVFLELRWNALVVQLRRAINEFNETDATVRKFNYYRAEQAKLIDNLLVQMGAVLERLTVIEAHSLGDRVYSAINDVTMARDMLTRYKDPTRVFVPVSDVRADFRCISGLFQAKRFVLQVAL